VNVQAHLSGLTEFHYVQDSVDEHHSGLPLPVQTLDLHIHKNRSRHDDVHRDA
jgi:hypothetical protein